jgi:hypothetical protein
MSKDVQEAIFKFLALYVGAFCLFLGLSHCVDPANDEGSAVLCDYVCTSDKAGISKCEWYCEDPQIMVGCNCSSGRCNFDCTECDVVTY